MELVQNLKQKKREYDYELIVKEMGLGYSEDDYFIYHGNTEQCNWVIHCSVVISQLANFIPAVLTIIHSKNLSFRLVKDIESANFILQDKVGNNTFGQVISIYCPYDFSYSELAEELKKITSLYKGPRITDLPGIGDNLYVEYQGKEPFHPDMWPFKVSLPKPFDEFKKVLFGKYMILNIVKEDRKGNVFTGKYITNFFLVKKCIIKQGKYLMWSDMKGRDVKDRLTWQRDLLDRLKYIVRVPKVIDLIESEGDTYLVMERISGDTLDMMLREIYAERTWRELSSDKKQFIISVLTDVLRSVNRLHDHGYIHRDLTPANFMINKRGELVLIDMELCYSLSQHYPLPPFGDGTIGFMSPEQKEKQTPSPAEDYYALGGMMIAMFTGIPPVRFHIDDKEELQTELFGKIGISPLVEAICKCYYNAVDERPDINAITQVISAISIS
ncbi:protein kinase [Chitinophaga sancti]|uniref:serine/threonine protein kinase n=1 Tax=Chitinophaga sancti TaxID=1004 RepID=UPI002A74F308|nr:protein kinase [Chitinophaga sancti]WPQ61912.1 protein kinase [Chitinophaga sancti]